VRKKVPAVLALSALLLAGCATAPSVYREVVQDPAGREVELETMTDGVRQTLEGPVPPEHVQELFAAEVVSIRYGGRPALLTAAEIQTLRALKGKQQ
jgi:hypothetical protein